MINLKISQLELHLKETVQSTSILAMLDSGPITQEGLIQVLIYKQFEIRNFSNIVIRLDRIEQ